jgi:hypothetical protein
VCANADPLGLASDAEIISALTKIGIWDTLESRGGLDAVLIENPLSQGQQQLFCLARAILRKSKVLILDEATSSLDSETDRVMQWVIREGFKEYTVISVAHRVSFCLLFLWGVGIVVWLTLWHSLMQSWTRIRLRCWIGEGWWSLIVRRICLRGIVCLEGCVERRDAAEMLLCQLPALAYQLAP